MEFICLIRLLYILIYILYCIAEILIEHLSEVTFDRTTLKSHDTNYQLNRNNRLNYRYIKIQTVKSM